MAKNIVLGQLDILPNFMVEGTLAAGSTSLTLSNSSITADSMVDIYTDDYEIAPTNCAVSSGSIVLTFDAQSKAVGVKVKVRN